MLVHYLCDQESYFNLVVVELHPTIADPDYSDVVSVFVPLADVHDYPVQTIQVGLPGFLVVVLT